LLLDFPKEARVLNREGGLCRERLQQLDGVRRERPGGLTDNGEAPEEVPLTDERDREQGPVAGPHERTTHSALGWGCSDVPHLDRVPHLSPPPRPAVPL